MNLSKILKNASYLFAGNIGVKVIIAISTILLARFVGPKEYGVFAIALAIANIAGYFADLGLNETFIREANKKDKNMPVLIGSYLKTRILLAIGAAVLSFIFIRLFYNDPYLINIINWIVFPVIIGTTFQGASIAFFQAKEKMGFSSSIVVIQGLLNSAVIFLAIVFRWPVTFLAPFYGCSYIITGLYAFLLLLKFTSIKNGWDKELFNQLFAFTINGIIIMLLPQLGPIILERVASLNIVGLFSTAYKIPSVLYQIPGVIATAFYPRLFMLGNNKDHINHRDLSNVELKLMSFIGIGISLPFLLNARFWILTLLGAKWVDASIALAIMAYMIILQSINYPLADYLTTRGQQYKRMIVMIFGVIVGITGYITLGRLFGLQGAAIVPVLIELTLLLGFCFFIKSSFSFLFQATKYNILSLIICIVLFKFLPTFYPFMWLTITVFLYALVVLLLDRTLLNSLKKLVSNKLRKNI